MSLEVLNIEPTEYTPGVILNPDDNTFMIWGGSRPEDARAFYLPILEWFDKYYTLRYWKDAKFDKSKTEAVFEFRFDYINSTSAKFILDILLKIGEYRQDNIDIKIQWYYDEADLDLKESGEAFEQLCKVPFEHICVLS